MSYSLTRIKKILIYVLIVGCFIAGLYAGGFSTKKAAGVLLPSFGGQELWWIPCTCLPGVIAIFYRPAQPSAFIGGPLVFFPGRSLLYMYFNIVTPGVWHAGQYIPGVQACWIISPTVCFPFPVLGVETQVGTAASPSPF